MRQRSPEEVKDAVDSAVEWFEENQDDFPEMDEGYPIILITSMAKSMLESEDSRYADRESYIMQVVETTLAQRD